MQRDSARFSEIAERFSEFRRYEILPCRLSHLRRLAATLRAADRAEIKAMGFKEPRHFLFAHWRRSLEPRAVLVDGEVAGAWGDSEDLLSDRGAAWFCSAPPIEKIPLAFFREARREITRMLQSRSILASDVHRDYTCALRFYRMLGFHVQQPDAQGWCRITIGG